MKIVKVSALVLLSTLGLGFMAVAPAQASDEKTKTVMCQAKDGGGYTLTSVDKKTVISTKDNHNENKDLSHTQDLVPPFKWNYGGNDTGNYDGNANWKSGGYNDDFIANGCKPTTNTVTAVLNALTTQATCMIPTGLFMIPDQNTGVTAKLGSAPVNGVWTITYTKPADTPTQTYVWGNKDFTGTQTVAVKSPLTTDPYWDASTGSCNLPDTGANQDLMLYGGIGAGVLVLGALLMLGVKLSRRRTDA